ncbi:Interleukin-6 [Cricetulus griseus]|uniref:Interleukin-6 n=1 Tax=Cricetulus griseus TaxID=10029 RepID=G3HVW6_CRIGR|nr:Interleukin-6 [Cricetulus griseus]
MKFLSARDFHPLAFLGLMLAVATALPTSQVRRGDFTEDTTPNRPVYTTSQQVGGLVTHVLREIFELRKEEICLLKITSGLLDYQIYLEFVTNNVQDNKKDKARVIQSTTKTLSQIFKQEVKDPDKIVMPSPTSKAILIEKLESQKQWPRTKTIELILKALEEFLKVTMRSTRQN